MSHLIIYSPVILSYEVEDPVNTVGGAILSVHLLAAPFAQDHRYCPEQGASYLLADVTTDQYREEWIDGDQISASAASALDVDRFVPIVCSGLQSSAGQNYQSPSSFAGLPAAAILSQLDSLVTEPDLIQVNRIRLLLAVPVHLVVDCHSVPGSRAWVIEPVHSAGDSVQGNALELQAIVRSP